MKKVILIKYGELTTKKANRNLFINTLYMNVKESLKDFEVKIDKNRVRMFIEPPLSVVSYDVFRCCLMKNMIT